MLTDTKPGREITMIVFFILFSIVRTFFILFYWEPIWESWSQKSEYCCFSWALAGLSDPAKVCRFWELGVRMHNFLLDTTKQPLPKRTGLGLSECLKLLETLIKNDNPSAVTRKHHRFSSQGSFHHCHLLGNVLADLPIPGGSLGQPVFPNPFQDSDGEGWPPGLKKVRTVCSWGTLCTPGTPLSELDSSMHSGVGLLYYFSNSFYS